MLLFLSFCTQQQCCDFIKNLIPNVLRCHGMLFNVHTCLGRKFQPKFFTFYPLQKFFNMKTVFVSSSFLYVSIHSAFLVRKARFVQGENGLSGPILTKKI
jgi:hypothetical protein